MRSLVGNWEMTSQTYFGDYKTYWHIKEIKGKLYGVSTMGSESVPFRSITVEGNHFIMLVVHNFGTKDVGMHGENELVMEGDYLPESDSILGTTTLPSGSESQFCGRRIE